MSANRRRRLEQLEALAAIARMDQVEAEVDAYIRDPATIAYVRQFAEDHNHVQDVDYLLEALRKGEIRRRTIGDDAYRLEIDASVRKLATDAGIEVTEPIDVIEVVTEMERRYHEQMAARR